MRDLNNNEKRTLGYLYQNPGSLASDVAKVLNVKDSQNGLQKAASLAVMRLRKLGYIHDVEKRCACCNRAQARKPNPLHLTVAGQQLVRAAEYE